MVRKTALGLVKKYHPNVTSVVDSKKNVRIMVNADDCQKAKKGSPSQCALARAFCREYDGAIVSKAVSYLIRGNKAFRFKTPEAVVREIVSFDRHQDFQPGEYQLRIPAKSQKLGAHRGGVVTPEMNAARQAKRVAGHVPPKRHQHKTAGIRTL